MLEPDLPERVAQCLARHQVGDQSVAVALSGGIDSMVLLDALAPLKAKNASRRLALTAIHVNHGISANADAWTGFCHAQCAQRGVPLMVAVVEVDRNSGAGLEAAARAARYAALMQSGAAFVLAAQHQDDQAETVLHQMLRGTGLNGLAGMGESRPLRAGQTLLRPLLTSSRAEIEAYATRHKLEWIEDESNLDTAFTRNFIRHELLPLIATRFPHYAESLSRTAQHAAESAELLAALAAVDLGCDDNPDRREVRADILAARATGQCAIPLVALAESVPTFEAAVDGLGCPVVSPGRRWQGPAGGRTWFPDPAPAEQAVPASRRGAGGAGRARPCAERQLT